MRKIIVTILRILDGTPAVYGKRQAGQSLVELALVTPILVILLAGLIEIGWFANNYLNLLDVTRAGARRGTVLQGVQSPLFFEDARYSLVPHSMLNGAGDVLYRSVYNVAAGDTEATRSRFRYSAANPNACNPNVAAGGVERRFYNEIICTMVTSMDPLRLNPDNDVDDIVISAFAIEMVDGDQDATWLPPVGLRPIAGDEPQMLVVGRWPTNANECNVIQDGSGNAVFVRTELRDPFDFDHDGVRQIGPPNGADEYSELEGADQGVDGAAETLANAERQRGFSLYANHRIPGTYCIGSDWTMERVEDLVNLPNYTLLTVDERRLLPGQGIVLVEMFWQHEMLLKIPVLSPVYTAVGNADGLVVIGVWAVFPLPAAEPFITFPLP